MAPALRRDYRIARNISETITPVRTSFFQYRKAKQLAQFSVPIEDQFAQDASEVQE